MSNYIVHSECIGEGQYHYTIVRELVRCGECKWHDNDTRICTKMSRYLSNELQWYSADDWYCKEGERRTDDKETD